MRADEDHQGVLTGYNVQQIPTFFLVTRDNNISKRDLQIKDIDAAIKALL